MTKPERRDGDELRSAITWAIKKLCPYCKDGDPLSEEVSTDGVDRGGRYHYTGGGHSECKASKLRFALAKLDAASTNGAEGAGEPLTYDEKVEMLRLADDIAGAEIADFNTAQAQVITRALRIAGELTTTPQPAPDAMRKALKPFAKAAVHDKHEPDSTTLYSSSARHEITLGHLRAAKAALSAPVPLPDGAGEPPHWREVEMMRLIDLLRSEEGDSVEIFCDNPDFGLGANNAVSCNGWWTGHRDRRFEGVSLLDALSAAMIEYKRPKSSDGGVGSQTRKELSADPQSLMAAGNVDSLGVAPGPSESISPSGTGAAEPVAHHYSPSTMHQGDCSVCGNVEDSVLHIGKPKYEAASLPWKSCAGPPEA